MKAIIKNILLLMLPLIMIGGLISSCTEDETVTTGEPIIRYVRITDPAAGDSLLVGAPLGNLVAIVGENLADVRELWFNDRQAYLNPAFITNTTILASVPNLAPNEVTNKMRLVFRNGRELLHDFETTISAPEVVAMSNEYAPAGSTAKIVGDFFFEPLTVNFTGGGEAEIVSVEQNEVEFIVPEGAQPGPITVSSNFGSTVASFHYKDQRNLILNYDDLTAAGSWRPGPIAEEDGIDGNYLRLFGTYNANERIEDNFASQFWGHTRWGADNPRQLWQSEDFEGVFPEDMTLKFEARVVDWYGSVLQITWGPYNNAGNQEYWSNLNGRGLWRPWAENDANFSTDGEWITVSIPLSEMIYSHGQPAGDNEWNPDMSFDKDVAGTLSFWVIATPQADNSPVEIHIDNVRIVEK